MKAKFVCHEFTNLVVAHLVVLIDPSKGYEPENRREIRRFAYEAVTDVEAEQFSENIEKIEPVMPFRLWDDKKTFYENQHYSQNTLKHLFSEGSFPKRFLKYDLTSMTPLQLARIYGKLLLKSEEEIRQFMDTNDPDREYFMLIGPDFIDFRQRRELEEEDPYLYIQYDLEKVIGCIHYPRDAFPVCPTCNKVFPCRFCHDDEVFDHKMERPKISEMQCEICGEIGPIGTVCQHCQAVVSTICCPKCHTLCQIGPEVKPAYHCDKCGVCRVGLSNTSKHCNKCDSCFDIDCFEAHTCMETCSCMVCEQDLSETIIPEFALKCNIKHRIHASCYEQMLRNGTYTCPLDHKVIIDDLQYAMIRAKFLSMYNNQLVTYMKEDQLQYCVKYRCYDCEVYSVDLYFQDVVPICHKCFGINCRISQEFFIATSELLKASDERDNNELALKMEKLREEFSNDDQTDSKITGEYLGLYRELNSELVPRLEKLNEENCRNYIEECLNLFQRRENFPE